MRAHHLTLGHLALTAAQPPPASDATIDALVARAQGGDTQAFSQIVTRYEKKVLGTAWRLLGNRADAMDAAQETFVRMYKYLGTFERGGDLGAWLYRIAINVSRRLAVQRQRAAHPVAQTSSGPGFSPEVEPSSGDNARVPARQDLERAMATLTEKERTALVLRDLEGLPTEEVARVLGSSAATVRVHICMARKKLRRYLDDAGPAGGRAPSEVVP